MRILFIANRLPYPLNDGGNIATYYNIHHLKQRNHRIDLLSFNTKKHFADPAPLEKLINVHAVEIDTQVTLKGAVLNMLSSLPYNISRFKSEHFSEVLTYLLERNTYDIIQMEGSYLGIYLEQIRKMSDAKVVLRAHNIEYKVWERISKTETSFLKSWYVNYLKNGIEKFEKKVSKDFDGIVPISNVDEAFFKQEANGKPVRFIPAGVDLESFQPQASAKTKSLFIIGNMQWIPNAQGLHWFLKSAWGKVKAAVPEATLHVAGKDTPQSIMKLNVEGVKIHGMVEDAKQFMNEHSIMLVPLLSGSGMRIKIIEGMALRKCIVSTKIGAEGIDAKNGEEIVIASEDEYANSIIALLRDEKEVDRIGANALQFVSKHYDWSNLILEFEDFYRQLL